MCITRLKSCAILFHILFCEYEINYYVYITKSNHHNRIKYFWKTKVIIYG